MKTGAILNSNIKSPLSGHSIINSKSAAKKRNVVSTLVLTSLVDAFSILVIYLLLQTGQNPSNIEVKGKIQLPIASQSEVIEAGMSVKLTRGSYLVNGEKVEAKDLSSHLTALQEQLIQSSDKRSDQIILQADKSVDFDQLNRVIIASAEAGINKVKFAVFPKSGE